MSSLRSLSHILLGLTLTFAFGVPAHAVDTNPCKTAFAKIGEGDRALENLYDSINSQTRDGGRMHAMSTRRGQGYLKIGELKAEDPEFLQAVSKAVAAGKIDEIEVGNIVGPKVLNWILRLGDSVPKGRSVKFTGDFKMWDLMEAKYYQVRNTQMLIAAGQESAAPPGYFWTTANVEQFEKAVERLHLEQVCKRLWGTTDLSKCGALKFQLRSDELDKIVWTRN